MSYATILFKLTNGKFDAFTIGMHDARHTESAAQSYAIGGSGRAFEWAKVIINGVVTFRVGDTA